MPPHPPPPALSSAQAGLENNTVISHTVLSLIHHGAGKNFSRIIFVNNEPSATANTSTYLNIVEFECSHHLSLFVQHQYFGQNKL